MNCTGLTNADKLVLPATTLADYCYRQMFYGCTSLTSAPEFPATTLADYCYDSMFYGCTNLTYVKAMFTTTPGTDFTQEWLAGTGAFGTFVRNESATWEGSITRGASTVPAGWTIITASE